MNDRLPKAPLFTFPADGSWPRMSVGVAVAEVRAEAVRTPNTSVQVIQGGRLSGKTAAIAWWVDATPHAKVIVATQRESDDLRRVHGLLPSQIIVASRDVTRGLQGVNPRTVLAIDNFERVEATRMPMKVTQSPNEPDTLTVEGLPVKMISCDVWSHSKVAQSLGAQMGTAVTTASRAVQNMGTAATTASRGVQNMSGLFPNAGAGSGDTGETLRESLRGEMPSCDVCDTRGFTCAACTDDADRLIAAFVDWLGSPQIADTVTAVAPGSIIRTLKNLARKKD